MSFLQSAPGADPIIVESLFRASVDRVFAAWTDPVAIREWFGPKPRSLVSADIDLRVGGAWRFVVNESVEGRAVLHGEYKEIEPPQRLVFTWQFLREAPDGSRTETPASTVTVTFVAEGVATRIHLRHEGIREEDARKGVGSGWTYSFGHLADHLSPTG